jgi:hypothetical protein
VQASFPYAHAEGIQNEPLKNRKTDAHAEHARKYAQRVHKGRSMRVRNSIFLIILKVPKTSKILKKSLFTLTNGLKSFPKNKYFAQTQKKSSLK